MHEHRRDTRIGKPWNGAASVFGKNPTTVAEAALAQAIVDDFGPLQPYLEPEHANLREEVEAFEEESSATWANLQLYRRSSGPDQKSGIDARTFG
jgi:hypothetical protein